ncbi:cytochrome P450 [Nocardiopsis sp. ATB16-24]|uniref:cytochrome P450 n=1 Tax=Nocardiopsis sp. ATB16-24 TaxID=3019555 RepID=UPI002556A7B2|nr:cytochrome P450 [Nocardiopsis sp. ATB16-24]
MTTSTEQAHTFPVSRGSCPMHPPSEYADWRSEEGGIHRVRLWDGRHAWVVTGWKYARKLLRDNRLCADRMDPRYPSESPTHAVKGPSRRAFRAMDGEQHTYYRRLLADEFSVRTADRLRPRIREVIAELLANMKRKGRTADLFEDFALPLPMQVTCEIIGVPFEDQEHFDTLVNQMLGRTDDPSVSEQAGHELSAYILEMIDTRTKEPTDDLMGRLVSGPLARGEISRDDVLVTTIILLLGGYESTASTLATGLLALMQNPAQLERARENLRNGEKRSVIEELLRYTSVTDVGLNRFALEDIEIGGKTIAANEGVIIHLPSVNRDPATFTDPDTLDVDRGGPAHVAFGFGPHQCVGQMLARAELEEALPALLEALPNLRLAVPEEELSYRTGMLVVGVNSLPVVWDD